VQFKQQAAAMPPPSSLLSPEIYEVQTSECCPLTEKDASDESMQQVSFMHAGQGFQDAQRQFCSR